MFFAAAFCIPCLALGRQDGGQNSATPAPATAIGEDQFAIAMILLSGSQHSPKGRAPIIGAFLAGLAMGRALPPQVHDLTQGITELLVPFLFHIGLHRLAVVSSLTVALSFVVLGCGDFYQSVGCGLGAMKYGRPVAIRVAFGMIPRGEFS